MQTCTRCNSTKSLNAFGVRKNRRGEARPHTWCLECVRGYGRGYQEKNAATLSEKAKARYEGDRESAISRAARWAQQNPDKARAAWRKYRRSEAGAAKHRAMQAERNAAMRAGPGVTPGQWAEILDLFGHRCAYCLAPKALQRDHVIALSRGGEHSTANVVPACADCNNAKADAPVFFMAERAFMPRAS